MLVGKDFLDKGSIPYIWNIREARGTIPPCDGRIWMAPLQCVEHVDGAGCQSSRITPLSYHQQCPLWPTEWSHRTDVEQKCSSHTQDDRPRETRRIRPAVLHDQSPRPMNNAHKYGTRTMNTRFKNVAEFVLFDWKGSEGAAHGHTQQYQALVRHEHVVSQSSSTLMIPAVTSGSTRRHNTTLTGLKKILCLNRLRLDSGTWRLSVVYLRRSPTRS